jgi:hypothetical protein
MEEPVKRFIAMRTFMDGDNTEYEEGEIYEVDETTEAMFEQWVEEGKIKDADGDDIARTIDELKARHKGE